MLELRREVLRSEKTTGLSKMWRRLCCPKTKTRRSAPAVEPAPAPAPDPIETTDGEDGLITSELADELLEDDEEGEEDAVIEDTSEIGGDEEDIGEVIGAVEESNGENA